MPMVWVRGQHARRINFVHRQLAAALGLVLALGLASPAGAEPLIGANLTPTFDRLADPIHAATELDISALDLAAAAEPQDKAMGANGVAALPAHERRGGTSSPARPSGQSPGTPAAFGLAAPASPTLAPSLTEEEKWARELSSSLKESVRPMYEELAGSAIVDAVRSLESDLGLGKHPLGHDPSADDPSHPAGAGARSVAVSWDVAGHRDGAANPPLSAAQQQVEKVRASLLVAQLIDEITPWAFAIAGVYVLGYMVKLWLDYGRWKVARRRKRHTMRRRHKQRPRVVDTSEPRV